MIFICAWCKKKISEKEPLDDNKVSHGICNECLSIEMAKSDERKARREQRGGEEPMR